MVQSKKVAVVGAGVAGLTAAWLLQKNHQVDLFEKKDYFGGHTHTAVVPSGHQDAGTRVDMGFIVMNHRNYPLFTRLLERLDVELGDTDMSFSFYNQPKNYYWSGRNIPALFSQWRNVLRPSHLRMVSDILRFNVVALDAIANGSADGISLSEFLQVHRFGSGLKDNYILPMACAIWSAPNTVMEAFPAATFLRFFSNHGLLTLNDRPQWRYVKGGSETYVKKILTTFKGGLFKEDTVRRVLREKEGVRLATRSGTTGLYDEVVLACHADEALDLLDVPTPEERELFRPWSYSENITILHNYAKLMPPSRAAWSSWNVMNPGLPSARVPVHVTYWMNLLQKLETSEPLFVSLNCEDRIPGVHVLKRVTFHHPVFTFESLRSQEKIRAISGNNRTHFCGAYLGHGFHEDAVRSAVSVANALGVHF